MTRVAIINGKKYTVDFVFNMIGNYYFTDKHGVEYLVDAEDVATFGGAGECYYEFDGTDTDGTKWYHCTMHDELAPSPDAPCSKWVNNPRITIDTAIDYARHHAKENEDGTFWWTTK